MDDFSVLCASSVRLVYGGSIGATIERVVCGSSTSRVARDHDGTRATRFGKAIAARGDRPISSMTKDQGYREDPIDYRDRFDLGYVYSEVDVQ